MEPIIVVGPGRCGTSCVAGVLHRLGVFMGTRLLGAHKTNPYGHWEDRDFLDLSMARMEKKISLSEWTARTSELLNARRSLGKPWGWKDPRTCNLLREYLELINDPQFIRCVRDPAKIEFSVVRAYAEHGWTSEQARSMRVRRERELDRYLPWYRTLDIDFDQMRESREQVILQIIEFCGLHASERQIREAVASVEPAYA